MRTSEPNVGAMTRESENVSSGFLKKKKKDAEPSTPRRHLSDLKGGNGESTKGKPAKGIMLRKNSSSKTEKDSEPKDTSFRGFGKRASFKLAGSKKGGSCPNKRVVFPAAEEDEQIEDDPVMALFETRNTNRVRFSLENVEGNKENKKGSRSADKGGLGGSGHNFNIKAFMRKTLFGGSKKGSFLEAEAQQDPELERLLGPPKKATKPTMIWESAETGDSPEVIHTMTSPKTSAKLMVSFTDDNKTRSEVTRLLSKAKRAQHKHFNYNYAINCYVKALDLLTEAKYPDDHPAVAKTMESLNNAYHAESSFKNSANIVKMGLRHEESGELVKALKMYTIAYRIRRDNLSKAHPSLIVLLNMLGSIQIKRGELKEAMQIYELALKDGPLDGSNDEEDPVKPPGNPLARSVTYRDMGTIHEKWGEETQALEMYKKSLECAAEWRALRNAKTKTVTSVLPQVTENNKSSPQQDFDDASSVQMTKSTQAFGENTDGGSVDNSEIGEMEVFLTIPDESGGQSGDTSMTKLYNSFFPQDSSKKERKKKKSDSVQSAAAEERDSFADVDVALTLHQIAQLYRKQSQFTMALDAYNAALRGMKVALGPHHPNVAAILGNIGNLHKEKGDMDAAYETYQNVLKLESHRLGLSHPEVAITLHNIGTIEAARGNYEAALTIYRKVLALQKRLSGEDHVSVAATTSCMGDVYQKLGDPETAMEMGEEALRIKMKALGKHSIEVARMLHKLGKLAFDQKLINLADSYITRALLIYRLNKVEETHEWIVEAHRDGADIDAALAMGAGRFFEC